MMETAYKNGSLEYEMSEGATYTLVVVKDEKSEIGGMPPISLAKLTSIMEISNFR